MRVLNANLDLHNEVVKGRELRKKEYEDAMKANKKEADFIQKGHGEPGKKIKTSALKAMHLSEDIFMPTVTRRLTESTKQSRLDEVVTMHDTMLCMNDEGAYMDWIYIMPDEPDYDDFKWFAEDKDEYAELVSSFNSIYTEYHDGGLYDAPESVIQFCHDKDTELGLSPIDVL